MTWLNSQNSLLFGKLYETDDWNVVISEVDALMHLTIITVEKHVS